MVVIANGRYELPENLYYTNQDVWISKEEQMVGLDEVGFAFLKNPLQLIFHTQPGEKLSLGYEFCTFITEAGMTSLRAPVEGVVKSINIDALKYMENGAYDKGYLLEMKSVERYADDLITGDEVVSWAKENARFILRGNLKTKIVMIGDSGVGKTALKVRFTDNYFKKDLTTTLGVDFGNKVVHGEYYPKDILFSGSIRFKMQMQIWDAAGQSHYSQMRPMYYRNAEGALLVFDVSNPVSFNHLEEWIEELENMTGPIPTILVGNKIDLKREVPREDAQKFADDHDYIYIETSAKFGDNVEKAFQRLSLEIYKRTFGDEAE